MVEYAFKKLGVGFITGVPKVDYREVIQDYAKDGWRLVQIFAPPIGTDGKANYFELIFEREILIEENN